MWLARGRARLPVQELSRTAARGWTSPGLHSRAATVADAWGEAFGELAAMAARRNAMYVRFLAQTADARGSMARRARRRGHELFDAP